MSTPVFDVAEVSRALALLHPAGHTFEVRVPNARNVRYNGRPDPRTGTAFGFFDSGEAALSALPALEDAEWPGLYHSLNDVTPALLARASNRIKAADRKNASTSDRDVERRTALLIDGDPVRPADISATDGEHAAALARIAEIRWFLSELGWPAPITADSGNGGHLVYRVELPAEDGGLVKDFLNALADAFDDERVHVDRTVFNAARIVKLWGTAARKGDSTADRPHRMSKILEVPAERGLITEEMLREATAALNAGREEKPAKPATASTSRTTGTFDVRDFMARHFSDAEAEDWHGGTRWILDPCPFNSDHKGTSAAAFQTASGVLAFKCQHNGCAGLFWKDLREKYAPKATRTAPAPAGQTTAAAAEPKAERDTAPKRCKPEFSAASHLQRGTYTGPRYRTGFLPLDDLLTPYNPAPLATDAPRVGLYPTKSVALIGAPGGGKTTAAAQVVHELLAVPGSRIVCLVVDEPGREFSAKLAQLAGWPLVDIDNAPKREGMLDRLDEALPLDRLMIVPGEDEEMTIEDAADLLFEKKAVLPVLVIDSASEATSRLATPRDSEQETINRNALAVKHIKAQGALVIYTAEPTKSAYASKDTEERTSPMAAMAFGRKATHGQDLAILLEELEDDVFRFDVFKNRITGKKGTFDVLLDRDKRRFGAITKDEAEKRQEEAATKKESFDDERVIKAVEKWAPQSDEGGLTDEEIRAKARMGKASADASRKRLVKFGRLAPFKPERQPGQVGPVACHYRPTVPTGGFRLTQTDSDSTQTKSGMSEGRELTQTPPCRESELITPTWSESASTPRTAAVRSPSLEAEAPPCPHEQRLNRWQRGRKWLVCARCDDEQPAEAPEGSAP